MSGAKKMAAPKPRITCDLYVAEKKECAGLRQLLCEERGKCPFYKTRKRAKEDRVASILARRAKGFTISDDEARLLLEALKEAPEREGR